MLSGSPDAEVGAGSSPEQVAARRQNPDAAYLLSIVRTEVSGVSGEKVRRSHADRCQQYRPIFVRQLYSREANYFPSRSGGRQLYVIE